MIRIMLQDCKNNGIPCSDSINIVDLLVDEGTRGEWNLQGLPADELSVENAIIVTRSDRYPLLVDPQGQALNWIKRKEEKSMKGSRQCITTATDPRSDQCQPPFELSYVRPGVLKAQHRLNRNSTTAALDAI